MHSPYRNKKYRMARIERSTQKTAARERKQKLRVSFGTGLWNVALEPERRKLLRQFRESPGKRPRMIPVIGSNAENRHC